MMIHHHAQNCPSGTTTVARPIRRKVATLMFTCIPWLSIGIPSTWATTVWSSAIRTNTTRNQLNPTTESHVWKPCSWQLNMSPGLVLSKSILCSITISILSAGPRTVFPDLRALITAELEPTKSSAVTSLRPIIALPSTLVSTFMAPTPKSCPLRYIVD